MKNLILISLIAFGIAAKAQYVANYKKIADTYFAHHQYYAASEYYKKGLGITSDTTNYVVPYAVDANAKGAKSVASHQEMVYKLAESSRLYKNYLLAEKYYALAKHFTAPQFSESGYYYALCLKSNGQLEEAIPAFHDYLNTQSKGKHLAEAKNQLLLLETAIDEMKFPQTALVSKLSPEELHTKGSNYSPVIHNGELYFTSSRPIQSKGKIKVLGKHHKGDVLKKSTEFLNHLYIASGDLQGQSVKVRPFFGFAIQNGREFATPTFTPDGKKAFFTSWISEDSLEEHKIYTSNLVNGEWTEPMKVMDHLNLVGSKSINPFITKDGKYLIFASDRSGGYGNYDLWYCPVRNDGSLGQAVNLGSDINSAGVDKGPYYNPSSGKLIYSSDGKGGFGGLDFYVATGGLTSLTKSKNMGHPINSPKDDEYFTSNSADDSDGYFSSDRESECCLEIFRLKYEYLSIGGTIIDCKTKKPLKNVKVVLSEREDVKTTLTDNAGNYNIKVSSRRPVKMAFELENYFGIKKDYSAEQLAKADTLMFEEGCMTSFKVNEPIVLENIYFEFNSDVLNSYSKNTLNTLYKILKDNQNLTIELSAHTDGKGTDTYNQDLSQRRAQSCVNYLIENGVSTNRLTARGYGESKPVAPNTLKNGKDNPEGRSKNRRTEFTVLGQDL